jgi:hypothetical protein
MTGTTCPLLVDSHRRVLTCLHASTRLRKLVQALEGEVEGLKARVEVRPSCSPLLACIPHPMLFPSH